MIARYHQEKEQNKVKKEKEEAMKLKRIASTMGKMVKEFWGNIEKVRLQASPLNLDFILLDLAKLHQPVYSLLCHLLILVIESYLHC